MLFSNSLQVGAHVIIQTKTDKYTGWIKSADNETVVIYGYGRWSYKSAEHEIRRDAIEAVTKR